MHERLTGLEPSEIDSLPFGYIALDMDGNIRRYNRYEADLARKDPQAVLGKNFFREVAPCTGVQEFEGRFRSFARRETPGNTLTFDFTFDFAHGRQKVRIGMVRSPLEREVIVTVNRVHDFQLAMSPEVTPDVPRGWLLSSEGRPVVVGGHGFWSSLSSFFANEAPEEKRRSLHRLGKEWGRNQALRVERFIQEQEERTLREVELQTALEALSGSVGVLGLGRFDVDLTYRDRGLLVVDHHGSPFAVLLEEEDGERCAVLAGFHAGLLSYLAGRSLDGREVLCGREPGSACRFVVGTSERLDRLVSPPASSTDVALLESLRAVREGTA